MKTICVVTGTRAEYGLLLPLLRALEEDTDFCLQLIVTGAHLSPEFGLTYQQIEADGFSISAKVDMLLSSGSAVGMVKSLGVAVLGLAEELNRLQPDLVLVLGDRYEMMAVAQTALLLGIPLGHIHGGERTEGAVDEGIRHAITKMAHIHFTAAEEYLCRVIQMGEDPKRVFNVGALGIDGIRKLKLLSKKEVERELNFLFQQKNFLVTLHSETLQTEQENLSMLEALLQALDGYPEAGLIITGANADTGGQKFNQRLQQYVCTQGKRAVFQMSLGQLRYFSVLQYCDLVIGNSSSGIIEAPFFKKPTVNIGTRQKGRLRAVSVVDCQGTVEDIQMAISQVLDTDFLQMLDREIVSPFGDGRSAKKIMTVLKKPLERDWLLRKEFYDIPLSANVLSTMNNTGDAVL